MRYVMLLVAGLLWARLPALAQARPTCSAKDITKPLPGDSFVYDTSIVDVKPHVLRVANTLGPTLFAGSTQEASGVVAATVGLDGRIEPGSVVIISPPVGPLITQGQMERLLGQSRYCPGIKDGHAVRVRMRVTLQLIAGRPRRPCSARYRALLERWGS